MFYTGVVFERTNGTLNGGMLGIQFRPFRRAAQNAGIPNIFFSTKLFRNATRGYFLGLGYKFDSRIAGRVRELIAAAKEDGYSLAIVSGYRTMDRSRVLYANKIAEYQAMGYDEATARVEAAKWVAPPGTSEHHSGLAMDIVSGDYYTKYSDLVEEFENEPEAVWLRENCARFGFILRFPKDKVEVTGINYEPWHFRYVGEEHAAAIMEQGLCLEEYLGEDHP